MNEERTPENIEAGDWKAEYHDISAEIAARIKGMANPIRSRIRAAMDELLDAVSSLLVASSRLRKARAAFLFEVGRIGMPPDQAAHVIVAEEKPPA
jgi:hypothetical protein